MSTVEHSLAAIKGLRHAYESIMREPITGDPFPAQMKIEDHIKCSHERAAKRLEPLQTAY
jgi:hypothetical protein